MKVLNDFQAIYHELSGRYGQLMSSRDACRELNVTKVSAARRMIPTGWIGDTKGLCIKTVSFARQLAELSN